jgi:putative oxidoreductase
MQLRTLERRFIMLRTDPAYNPTPPLPMRDSGNIYSLWAPKLLSVLRIVLGFLLIPHGLQKLFGLLDGKQVELASLMGLAGIIEVFGGILILVGLFTRPVAFIVSGFAAFAYFIAHAPQGFWPILNRGELAVVYCFLYLYLSAAGGGEWSLDRLLRKSSA